MSLIIICDRPGRLANLLVVFTHFAALALERDIQILNPSFSIYKQYFRGTASQRIPHYNLKGKIPNLYLPYSLAYTSLRVLRRIPIHLPNTLQLVSLNWNEQLDLNSPMNQSLFSHRVCIVGGWLYRCESLVHKYKSQLLEFFQPLDKFRDEATRLAFLARQFACAQTLIGIHIRLGDYKDFKGGKYFYPLSFYRSLIQTLNAQYPNRLAFIIVSDQPLTTQDFGGLNVYISNSSEIVDMKILSLCDGVIGPPSTFSYYASTILGNGKLFHLERSHITIPKDFIDSVMTH